jgi:hypothetical protein
VTEARPICSVAICDRPVLAKGLCTGHYSRVWRTGQLKPDVPIKTEMYVPHPETHNNGARNKCINGHEFNEANTAIEYWRDGTFKSRRCRTCAGLKQRKVDA